MICKKKQQWKVPFGCQRENDTQCCCAAIVLFGLVVIVTVIVVNTVWSLKDKDIKNQMEAVSNQVVQYFESFFAYEKFIGDYDSVKQLLA